MRRREFIMLGSTAAGLDPQGGRCRSADGLAREHSRKPAEAYEAIEAARPGAQPSSCSAAQPPDWTPKAAAVVALTVLPGSAEAYETRLRPPGPVHSAPTSSRVAPAGPAGLPGGSRRASLMATAPGNRRCAVMSTNAYEACCPTEGRSSPKRLRMADVGAGEAAGAFAGLRAAQIPPAGTHERGSVLPGHC